ncbi:phage tail length tape measure family protein [Mesorhizobium sp. M1380]|uniref:phage tail length tape measure family protein n=1 Tax=Mesorhizobium sp. M1380 TaxID=2957093 RepID=UPI003338659B
MTVQLSRLITSAEIDASKYLATASQMVAADRDLVGGAQAVGQAFTSAETKISQSGDALTRLSRQYVEGFTAQQRFDSGLGSLARGLDSGKIKLEQAQSILIGMNQKLGLSANASELAAKGQTQLAAAVGAANAQIQGQALAAEKTIASAKRMQAANANVAAVNHVPGAGAFNTANIAAQFQDIGVTAAMGMSPLQIALQQGTQLQAVLGPLGAGGAVKALGGAFLSLVNPVSLVTLALVGGTAAAIQYFMKGRDGAKSMAEATKMHSDSLKLLKEQYGDLAEVIKTVGTVGGQAFTAADVRANQAMLNTIIRSKGSEMVGGMTGGMLTGYLSDANPLTSLLDRQKMGGAQGGDFAGPITSLIESARQGHTDIPRFEKDVDSLFKTLATRPGADVDMLANTRDSVLALGEAAFEVKGKFEPFQQVINRFQIEVAENHPNLSRFNADIEAIGATRGITKLADEVISLGKDFVETARQAQELKAILDRIDRENTRPGLADRRALGGYVAGRDAALGRENDQFEAEQQMARARTNAEKLAAIEAQVRARAFQDADKGGGLQARVDRALQAERNRQALEARDAELDRGRAIDKTLASQQLDLQLIGKTAGETARLRMEFEQIAAIREEAALKGVPADEAEIARIKEKAAAYGLVADEIARANLAKDLNFEREQQFRSAQDQQIASRQQGAGLDVDLNSPAAQQMRDIARFADAKGLAVGFLTDFKSELLRNGGDVGKALGEAVLNALTASMDKQLANIFDRLATWFASWLTGQMPGAGGAGVGAAAAGAVGAIANDNYAPGAVTRAPLAAAAGSALSMVGNYKAGVDPRLTDILNSAALQTPGYKVDAFSGYRPGDPRFHGRGLATDVNLTDLASGKSLGNYQDASSFRAYEEFAQNARKVQMAKYPELNDEFRWGGYFGGPKGKYGAMDQMHFDLGGGKVGMGGGSWAGGLNDNQRALFPGAESYGIGASANTATTALDKMSTNAFTASQNLGGLGGSVTSAVDALTGGVGGKGGLASILEGLKPGNFTPDPGGFAAMLGIGAGTAAPAAGGGGGLLAMLLGFLPKLFGFADGTENAPEGWAWVGERGPELRKLRGGDVIRSHGRSMDMAANANMSAGGGGRGQEVNLHVNVYGGSGDEHIRLLARQGAQQAIGDYHEAQASGGFGELQRRYNSQKG